MKKFYILFYLFFLQPAYSAGYLKATVNFDRVNVRHNPDLNSEVELEKLMKNQILEVEQTDNQKWLKIITPEKFKNKFIYSELVVLDESVPENQPQEVQIVPTPVVPEESKSPITSNSPLVFTISTGLLQTNYGSTQTLIQDSSIERKYVANDKKQQLPKAEFFVGLKKQINSRFYGEFGLMTRFIKDLKFRGTIWEDSDPQFDNFTYQYFVQHNDLAIKSKIFMPLEFYALKPFGTLNLGASFNKSYSYSSTPTIDQAVNPLPFQSKTKTSITYGAGVGIQRSINHKWEMGFGYEYNNLGKAQLDNGLEIDHINSHEILLNLSYYLQGDN